MQVNQKQYAISPYYRLTSAFKICAYQKEVEGKMVEGFQILKLYETKKFFWSKPTYEWKWLCEGYTTVDDQLNRQFVRFTTTDQVVNFISKNYVKSLPEKSIKIMDGNMILYFVPNVSRDLLFGF